MVCALWTSCCLMISVVGVAERAAWLFHKQAPASGAQEEDQLAHLGHCHKAEAHEQPHLAPNGTCPTQHHRQSQKSKARTFFVDGHGERLCKRTHEHLGRRTHEHLGRRTHEQPCRQRYIHFGRWTHEHLGRRKHEHPCRQIYIYIYIFWYTDT